MTQEEKELLSKDLSSRLFYGVICHANKINIDGKLIFINKLHNIAALYYDKAIGKFESCPINDIKPYLRSMDDMTNEEEFALDETRCYTQLTLESYDWLNAHHFDYRGLIEKGLAFEASDDMYK